MTLDGSRPRCETSNDRPDPGVAPLLVRARGLLRTYRSADVETKVLRGVDLEVARGSFLALLGPSGCGKTTLLNLVGALDRADGGVLTVAGVDLMSASPRELVRYRQTVIGLVFQFYNLIPTLTAQENVELLLEPLGIGREERTRRSTEALERVGLSAHRHRLPGQLSGGQQQRVAIARALCRRPPLILADEPTGNLDRRTSREVVALLRELNQEHQMTFIIVTHDPEVAAQAQIVAHMEDGRITSTSMTHCGADAEHA
jgi:ABC-type lipoprotein export system ATPase subunit